MSDLQTNEVDISISEFEAEIREKSTSKKITRKSREAKIYSFNAFHLAEALKLKEVAKIFDLKPMILNPTRLVYELSENSLCILYNFGSIVFFNVDAEVQKTTLERLKDFLPHSKGVITTDTFLLEERARSNNEVFFDKVVVDKLSPEKIALIAMVLAQSTALDFFEGRVENLINRLETMNATPRKVQQFIRTAMMTKQNLIGTLHLLENPDETWENQILNYLHEAITNMFELKDRFRTLDYKLKTMQENLALLSNFSTNHKLLSLEWAIVLFFALDLIMLGYEIFIK